MIGIIGHMSGGKTYTAVRLILNELMHGRIVCTNIKLNCIAVSDFLGVPCWEWKRHYYYMSDSGEGYNGVKLSDYENYPCGHPRGSADYAENVVSIFFDEVSSVFDSITHSSNDMIQRVAVWARHTEKRGQYLYLIMQFPSELHKRLRNHVTEYLSCVNAGNLRLPVVKCRLPKFFRNYIVVSPFLADGETQSGNSEWFPIDPRVYKCYNTGQIVFGSLSGRMTSASSFDFTRRNVLQLGGVIWGLLALQVLVFLMFGGYCLWWAFRLP